MFVLNDKSNAQDVTYMSLTPHGALTKERAMAFLIGVLAIFLAFGVAWLDETFAGACARSSISHYFYEPLAGTFFVMVLSFVGAFMIAFRGENAFDGWLATLGGLGGLVLAFFPTAGIGCAVGMEVDLRPAVVLTVPEAFGMAPLPDRFDLGAQVARIGDAYTQRFHFYGAIAMFAALFIFAFWVFTRVNPDTDLTPDGRLKTVKILRNALYLACSAIMALGVVMIVADGWGLSRAVSLWMSNALAALPMGNLDYGGIVRPVYHGEMLALVAFGVSWIVKGRFGTSAVKLLLTRD